MCVHLLQGALRDGVKGIHLHSRINQRPSLRNKRIIKLINLQMSGFCAHLVLLNDHGRLSPDQLNP